MKDPRSVTDAIPVLVLAVLLVVSGVGGFAGVAGAGEPPPTDRADGRESDRFDDAAGYSDRSASGPHVAVTARRADGDGGIVYDVRVTGLRNAASVFILTDGVEVDGSSGVVRDADQPRRYRWDGTADAAEVHLTPPRDRTGTDGPTLEREEWAFGPVPALVIAWQPRDGGDFRRVRPFANLDSGHVSLRVPDGGFVGKQFAMVGRVTVHRRAIQTGTIRLVVPRDVDLRADPTAVLEAIAAADDSFEDGAGNETVTVFALPRAIRDGGATYVSSDEAWVNANARLRTPNNVWLHEYVHTRQSFDLGPQMVWFKEASAEYFSAQLAREVDLTSRRSYGTYLAGRSSPTGVLAEPDSWTDDSVPYHQGVRVLAALDAEISKRTEGKRSLENVFARMNRHEGTISYDDFVRIVTDVAGEEMRPWLDRHVTGPETVTVAEDSSSVSLDGPLPPASALIGLSVLGGLVIRRRPSS